MCVERFVLALRPEGKRELIGLLRTAADDPFPARLTVSVRVPDHDAGGWRVEVTFSAIGPLLDFSRDTVMKFLESMHRAVYHGYCVTFSDEIVDQTKGMNK